MHIKDFICDLKAKGRNEKYVFEMENKLTLLVSECGWLHAKDEPSPKDLAEDDPTAFKEELASAQELLYAADTQPC